MHRSYRYHTYDTMTYAAFFSNPTFISVSKSPNSSLLTRKNVHVIELSFIDRFIALVSDVPVCTYSLTLSVPSISKLFHSLTVKSSEYIAHDWIAYLVINLSLLFIFSRFPFQDPFSRSFYPSLLSLSLPRPLAISLFSPPAISLFRSPALSHSPLGTLFSSIFCQINFLFVHSFCYMPHKTPWIETKNLLKAHTSNEKSTGSPHYTYSEPILHILRKKKLNVKWKGIVEKKKHASNILYYK